MKKHTYAAALAMLLAATTDSQALTLTYATSTPISSTTTDWVSSLAFQQFDSSIYGVLLSVELQLSSTFNSVLTITNSAASASNGTSKTEVQLTVQDVGGNLIAPTLDLLGPTFPYSLAPGASVTSGTLTKSGTSDNTYASVDVLNEFTGAGTFTLPASTFTQTLLANTGGNSAASQVTDASLTGTVTYTYAVPEPTSAALLGLGTLGLVARRRRSAQA